jgi:hypothetical protein
LLRWLSPASLLLRGDPTSAQASSRRRCLLRVYRSRGPTQTSLGKIHWMSRRPRPHYRSGLGWILGVAFVDTLTRPVRLAQGFTHIRCCGSPRASSPHGLTAPALASHDGRYCVQLPPARGCYHLAPRRTFTSNPVPMPGTPTFRYASLRATDGAHSANRLRRVQGANSV